MSGNQERNGGESDISSSYIDEDAVVVTVCIAVEGNAVHRRGVHEKTVGLPVELEFSAKLPNDV